MSQQSQHQNENPSLVKRNPEPDCTTDEFRRVDQAIALLIEANNSNAAAIQNVLPAIRAQYVRGRVLTRILCEHLEIDEALFDDMCSKEEELIRATSLRAEKKAEELDTADVQVFGGDLGS